MKELSEQLDILIESLEESIKELEKLHDKIGEQARSLDDYIKKAGVLIPNQEELDEILKSFDEMEVTKKSN
jgi:archaellum component FlaC